MGNERTKKSSPVLKIIIAILIIAVLAVIGYGAYKYCNCDKNENGVSYSAGKTKDRVYTNDWAEVKIDLDTGLQDYTPMVYIPSIQNILDNLNNVLKDRNGSAEAIFLGAKLRSSSHIRKYLGYSERFCDEWQQKTEFHLRRTRLT